MHGRVINFAAGPSQIPLEVLEQAHSEFFNFRNSGMSVLELGHRGVHFEKINAEAEADLRQILSIPSNYRVLFLQAGGTGQFAAVPLNLIGKCDQSPDYLVTGKWSQSARDEAKLYSKPNTVAEIAGNSNTVSIPDQSTWKLNGAAPYFYYCDNETIHGIELPFVPVVPEGVPIVADMSSNFLTRPVDVSKYGVIYAGAQKNCGTSGLTIVIVREDLLTREKAHPVPTVLHWKKNSDLNSLLNTPPLYAIYIAGLVFKWVLKNGGINEMEARCKTKSDMIYEIIDHSDGFYNCLNDKNSRSRVNITFTITPKTLQDQFVKEGENQGLHGLAGHRSVGGIRISLFNAITIEETTKLSTFMKEFQKNNHKK